MEKITKLSIRKEKKRYEAAPSPYRVYFHFLSKGTTLTIKKKTVSPL
jgi:hypothetical protein